MKNEDENELKRIVLLGGTGLIGHALLARLLEKKYHVILIVRDPDKQKTLVSRSCDIRPWVYLSENKSGEKIGDWGAVLDGAYAVINLAGEPVMARRWSDAQKRKIVSSRVEITRAMVLAIAMARVRPQILINASAVGYYGPSGDEELNEFFPAGGGFLAGTCEAWEKAARVAEAYQVRTVLTRFGVVLARGGGALEKISKPFHFFAGGQIGSGRQWVSWIHLEDAIGAILFALENPALEGPLNVTSPQPVPMKDFCRTLGEVMRRPAWLPVPARALKIILGESAEMLLEGQRAMPARLLKAGYQFIYPELKNALESILTGNSSQG